jgi:hypothetical protein
MQLRQEQLSVLRRDSVIVFGRACVLWAGLTRARSRRWNTHGAL